MEHIQLTKQLWSSKEAQAIDQYLVASGIPSFSLMTQAGTNAWSQCKDRWTQIQGVVVFCGPGNNGGDGWVFASTCAQEGIPTIVIDISHRPLIGNAALAAELARQTLGLEVIEFKQDAVIESLEETLKLWTSQLAVNLKSLYPPSQLLIVDAIFGVGQNKPLESPYVELIETINTHSWSQDYADIFPLANTSLSVEMQVNSLASLESLIIALDVPSGIDPTYGHSLGSCHVLADLTITFIVHKQGLFRGEGKHAAGQILIEPLGLELLGVKAFNPQIREEQVFTYKPISGNTRYSNNEKSYLQNTHKGTFGSVTCIGGYEGMGGAIILCSEAASLSGAGKTIVVSQPSTCQAIMMRSPHIITETDIEALDSHWLTASTLVVIGPGLGKTDWAESCMHSVFKQDVPCVFDADALNLISDNESIRNHYFQWISRNSDDKPSSYNKLSSSTSVMTPHPKEANRLMPDYSNPFKQAMAISELYQTVCVLKGFGSIIADWSTNTLLVCETGNSALSKAGQGDTLAGIIASFLAQGYSTLDATAIAVWAHGKAAQVWVDSAQLNQSCLSLLPQETTAIAMNALKDMELSHDSNTHKFHNI